MRLTQYLRSDEGDQRHRTEPADEWIQCCFAQTHAVGIIPYQIAACYVAVNRLMLIRHALPNPSIFFKLPPVAILLERLAALARRP